MRSRTARMPTGSSPLVGSSRGRRRRPPEERLAEAEALEHPLRERPHGPVDDLPEAHEVGICPGSAPPLAPRQAEEVRVVLVQLAGRGPAGELELLGEGAEETSRRPGAGRAGGEPGAPTRRGAGATAR